MTQPGQAGQAEHVSELSQGGLQRRATLMASHSPCVQCPLQIPIRMPELMEGPQEEMLI